MIVMTVGMRPLSLRLPRQKGICRKRALKNLRIMMTLYYCTTNSFVKKNGDGDAKSLLSFISFMPPAVFAFLFMSL
jgi:hypothetical protein